MPCHKSISVDFSVALMMDKKRPISRGQRIVMLALKRAAGHKTGE